MRSILRPVSVTLLLLVLAGCGSDGADGRSDGGPGGTSDGTSGSTSGGSAGGDDRDRLAQARETWSEAGLSDYDWSYERQCFCPSVAFDLEVRDDELQTFEPATGSSGALPSSTDDLRDAEPSYRTIDDLFSLIEGAIESESVSLSVEYDAATGYPARISIDPDADTFDDESGIVVTGLVAVQSS